MALTLAQIQAMITNKEDSRQIINEIVDYLEANPGGGAGVASIIAGTNITLGGTATNPVINAAGGSSYLSYVAIINQTGTDDPVATVLTNTLGGTLIWTRSVQGFYLGTLTGTFPDPEKVWLAIQLADTGDTKAILYRNDADSVGIETVVATVNTDGVLNNTSIEIRVYP